MINKEFVERDLQLKQLSRRPRIDDQPRYDWMEGHLEEEGTHAEVELDLDGEPIVLNRRDLADELGQALTDVLQSQDETDIYSQKNRLLVRSLVSATMDELVEHSKRVQSGNASAAPEEISRSIERALVGQDAYDVAKSFIQRHQDKGSRFRGINGYRQTTSTKLIRRNGHVVPWNPSKIEIAICRAFLSLQLDPAAAKSIAEEVTREIESIQQDFIHIEKLQDKVQETLMRLGYYKVAEAYILYRAHRSDMREQMIEEETAISNDQQDSLIIVKQVDGETYLWDGSELRKRIEFASIGLELCLTSDQIESELRRSFYSEMRVEDLRKTVILNAKSLIEKDADFSKFAGRILLSYIYEEVLGWSIVKDGIEKLSVFHARAFKEKLRRGVELKRIHPRMLEFDLDRLAHELDPVADLAFDYLGIQTLYDRYLIVDKQKKAQIRLETPQLFWMRVSMGLFVEQQGNREDRVIALYRLYKSRRFCSSTPTLFNSGTLHSQLSSCYLYQVGDSIESIMARGISENAYLSKWAGGLGGSWTAVRGTGSYIQGTNGESQGVIPFLKLHNDQLVAVNQGGKRRGSGCAYLETWHNDIFDFLELRKNTGDDRRRTHDMNTANWIPDLFMKRMEERKDWTLFRSNETADLHELYGKAFEQRYEEYEELAKKGEIFSRVVPAIDVWKAILKMLFETGHPWITFKDPCNVRSPQDHTGVIHSSNLCTEITLNTGEDETAVCNLGSVVIESHLDSEGNLDHDKLRETVRVAVEALDNVIDINFYPTQPAENSNRRHRPIGLGVMGLQNALYIKGIPFASDEAVDFNDEMMEAISYYAYEASSDLAADRGTYSSYKGSKWDRGLLPQDTIELLAEERGCQIDVPRGSKMDWAPVREKIKKQGLRNSNVLAIAPTATISNIMGSMPCIEPAYRNLYVKSNLSGDFIVLNQFLVRDLKARGLWDQTMIDRLKYFDGELEDIEGVPEDLKKKYATAFAIPYEYFIKAAARRQKWIDQSQSVNLFLATPDLKSMSHMYRAAWRSGMKTTYYLRTLGASNIEKATVDVSKDRRSLSTTAENGAAAATATAAAVAGEAPKKEYTPAEKAACSIDAMINGGTCEACQ
ncbi:ribonucleoside-diphosphate reductase subunit alpha [bacterium]|nr:ribonucleoside-diphosphate reductase subunit alpha [bacterium]